MILFRLIGLFFDLLLLPIRLRRRGRLVPKGTWLTMTIDGPVVDIASKPRFWQFRAQKAFSLHVLDDLVTRIAKDSRVKGLLITLRSMTSGGMATASSLRAILQRARAAGKEVAIHLPMGGDSKEVYIATAASKILLGPSAQLAPLGFRTASHYVKNALDRAGIEPQVFSCGEFKSAGETLVRDSMSPAQRAQLERLIETFHTTLIDSIVEGRSVSREDAEKIVDEAPYFGRAAVDAKLADHVAYEDEVPSKLEPDFEKKEKDKKKKKKKKDEKDEKSDPILIEADHYLFLSKIPTFRKLRRPPVIAVVSVHGAITHSVGGSRNPFGSDTSMDEKVTRSIRAVRRNRRVRGVILHIDSPGGSALASDIMHHEIEQLAREKPVVACMANVAASGGYYVAAPADVIVAEPTTVTGSIGVVAARFSLTPLLSRLGIVSESVEKGKRAKLLSAMGPLDEDSRSTIMRELDATYKAFIAVVAAGREMKEDDVERLARGRVYTGKDAKEAGLVDVLGGFDVAIAEVKKLLDANVRDRTDLEVRIVRPPRSAVPFPDLPDDDDDDGQDEKKEAEKKALFVSMVSTLLPKRERMILNLALRGDRVLAIAPLIET